MTHEWADLTWEELEVANRTGCVAVLPVGALEAHGPHLPLGTDILIAQAMAEAGAEQLRIRKIGCMVLPPLAFTAAPFAASFPGTISVSPSTVTALLLDLAREVTRHGFAVFALANAHLDPSHRAALAEAERRASEERLVPFVCPDLAQKPWALRLTEEFRSGACHAGRYEGSIVLATRPELVREEVRAGLPPNPASLSRAIRDGAATFQEAGGPRAYFGWPAEATAEEGRSSVQELGNILCQAVLDALGARTS